MRRIRQKVTQRGTDWLWDIWVLTIAYVGWLFDSLFPVLLFSALDLGPVQMASARVFATFGVSQVEVHFLHAPDQLEGHPEGTHQ